MFVAPEKRDGKQKVFQEVFKSPEILRPIEAIKILNEIRKAHPSELGWVEFSGYVERTPSGKWCAVRYHAKYE